LAVGAAFGARGDSLSSSREVAIPAEGGNYVLKLNDAGATFTVSAPNRSAVKVDAGVSVSSAIYPSFAAVSGPSLPSLELCRWRGRAFEEGAWAAAELQLEEAVGPLASGRAGFLKSLALKLKEAYDADERPSSRVAFGDAMSFVGTALALSRPDGKVPADLGLPAEVASKAGQDKERFLKEEWNARVLTGRYAWGDELKRAYLTGLWLGRRFERGDEKEFKAAIALTWVVESDPDMSGQYSVLAGLANASAGPPPGAASLDDYRKLLAGRDAATVLKEVGTVRKLQADAKESGDAFVFIPAPGHAELELIRRFALTGVRGDGAWATAYVAAVRADGVGRPGPASPWLDYVAYAAAALSSPDDLPEARKLTWDDGYRARLAESFVTAFDQVRARAPAAPPSTAEAPAVEVTPEFRLEPVPEYYLRMARAYGRMAKALDATFSRPTTEGMRGLREGGKAGTESLAVEADEITQLFYGLYLLSCADCGLTPAVTGGEVRDRAGAAALAHGWLEKWREDTEMARDVREAYPLGPADPTNPAAGTLYRCILGVRALDVEIKYDKKPGVALSGSRGQLDLHFKPITYTLLVPVVVEVAVPGDGPLTNAAFRKLCDEHKAEGAIVAALKEYGQAEEVPVEEVVEDGSGLTVDSGAVVLIVILAVFALIIIIALIASRQRYY
jgi:hypothetical protein